MKVAIFGGSFNPPHVSHLLVASYVLATRDVDELWLMPARRHAFGKALAPFEDRVEMCRLLAAELPDRVKVSKVEAELAGSGRTVDTLEHLKATYPDHQFRLVIGADILGEADRWEEFERVEELAPLLIVARSGHPHPRAQGPAMPEISSTRIRELLRQGQSKGEDTGEEVETLVPRKILAYIRERGLYR